SRGAVFLPQERQDCLQAEHGREPPSVCGPPVDGPDQAFPLIPRKKFVPNGTVEMELKRQLRAAVLRGHCPSLRRPGDPACAWGPWLCVTALRRFCPCRG